MKDNSILIHNQGFIKEIFGGGGVKCVYCPLSLTS